MEKIQVHSAGTAIIIDRAKGTIGTQYPDDEMPREIYNLDEDWIKKYTVCRRCGCGLNNQSIATGFWRHELQICSLECLRDENLARYACCPKAKPLPCVCLYSTTCPEHGERHIGSHD